MKPMLKILKTNDQKYKLVSLFFSNVEEIYEISM